MKKEKTDNSPLKQTISPFSPNYFGGAGSQFGGLQYGNTTLSGNQPITSGLTGGFQGSLTSGINLMGGGSGTGGGLTFDMGTFGQNLGSQSGQMGLLQAGVGIASGLIGRGKRKQAQLDAQSNYDEMLEKYRNLDTSNLAANIENPFAENVFEDLTVNQQQAEFERNMFRQQQADTLSSLRGAAGSSGIAGLAQVMANQAQVQSQKAAASIGAQEAANQRLAAQGALQVQKGEAMSQQLRLQGAERARALEYQQTATQLGMSQQELIAANQAMARGNAQLMGGIGSLVGTVAGAAIGGPAGMAIGGKLGGMVFGG